MRYFFLIILLMLGPAISANDKDASLWGLTPEFYQHWSAKYVGLSTNPSKALNRLRTERLVVDEKNTLEQLYIDLLEIALMIALEQNPGAASKVEAIFPKAEKISNKIYLAKVLYLKAAVLDDFGDFGAALNAVNSAIDIMDKLDATQEMGLCYLVKGRIYRESQQNTLAMESLLKAYDILKKYNKNKLTAEALSGIAMVHDRTGQHERAIEYYLEALHYIDEEKDLFLASMLYYNIAHSYSLLTDIERAEEYLLKALALSEQLDDVVGQAYAKAQLATVYHRKKKYKQAVESASWALQVFIDIQDIRMTISAHSHLAESYVQLKKYSLASEHLTSAFALSKSIDAIDKDVILYEIKTKMYRKKGQLKKALDSSDEYALALEKNYAAYQEKAFLELKIKFDSEKKHAQNIYLKQENDLKQIKLERHQSDRNMLLVFILLILLLVVFTFHSVIKQVKARKRFASLAMTDELTAAPNRRHILEFAKLHLKIARDSRTALTVAVIDLDYFKKINDTFGHDVGDNVLVAFYQAAAQAMRGVDRIGRIGGEEWMLVLPGLNLDSVESLFDRVKKYVEVMSVDGLDQDNKITFSMGAAQLGKDDEGLDSILKRCDQALYQAKANGRDQWMIG